MARAMESEEAARRLGVKRATLYAYVSRGILTSHPSADGRRSLFEVDEVEALARRSRGGRRVETRLATVTTGVTQLREDGPIYRGLPAIELSRSATFEEVADLLWQSESPTSDAPPFDPQLWQPAPLDRPAGLRTMDRLRWAVVMAGATDPLRSDLRPEKVVRVGRRLVATMTAMVGEGTDTALSPIAARLATRLSPEPTEALVRAIDTAMVLLADHELATSTVAVRVVASTRADPYDGVLAGLAALAGPLHGGAGELAFALLAEAERDGAEHALNEALRWQRVLPGFGHTVFRVGDPRAPVLLDRFADLATPSQRALLDSMVALAASQQIPPPNVDLGLAAMSWATGMPADAGRTIFAVARVAGWIAHYLEELAERPLRFRARAVYATGAP